MSWKNIKTFMIALLLIACTVIFVMLLLGGNQEPYTAESLEKSAALMRESGIILDKDLLKGDFEGMKPYRFTLPRDYPEQVAQKLVNGNITDVFTVPDGVELRSDSGEILYVGNDFTVRYSCPDRSNSVTQEDLEQRLLPLTESPKFGISRKDGDDPQKAIYVQTIGNYPIPENEMICSFADGKLVSMEGKWCFPDKCSTFSAQLRDYLNIMFTERERISSEAPENVSKKDLTVESLEKCYGIENTDSKNTFVLVPSLSIIYKEGEQVIHSAVAG
ncbi:MAG: hypothetical protein IJC32_01425 [Clostridia bacterium]|nr:hypothetical protein [Clostridia bacterium]